MHWIYQLSSVLVTFILWKVSMGYSKTVLDYAELISGVVIIIGGTYVIHRGLIIATTSDYTSSNVGWWIVNAVGLLYIIGWWWTINDDE